MQEKWGFDKNYLKKQIAVGEIVLENKDIFDPKQLQNYGLMVAKFKEYLHMKSKTEEIRLTPEMILEDLKNKMINDLDKLELEKWLDIREFCDSIPNFKYLNHNMNNLDNSPSAVKKEVLKFYRQVDKNSLPIVKEILDPKKHLINMDTTLRSHCFPCLALNKCFININQDGDYRYPCVVHEVQHAIDRIINDFQVSYLFIETAPMFMETLFIDNMNKKRNNKYVSLYGDRIENNYFTMGILKEYVNFLELFEKNGSNITLNNIDKILLVDDEEDLKRKYQYLMYYKYQECYAYVNSFFTSLELREMYYNTNKKIALELLKKYVSGIESFVDRNNQSIKYKNFINEINGKNKHYVAKHLK